MSKVNLTEFQLLDLIATYQSSISKLKYQLNDFETTLKALKSDLKEVRAAAKVAAKKTPVTAKNSTATKKAATPAAKKPAGRRGRPRKNPVSATAKKTETAPKAEAPVAKKPAGRRGRPRKNPVSAATTNTTTNGVAKAPAKTVAKAKAPAKKTPAKKVPAKTVAAKNDKGYKLSEWDQLVLTSVKSANRVLTRSELDALVSKKAGALKKGMETKQVNAKISNVLHKLTNKRKVLKKDKTPENKTGYTLA